MTAISTFTYVLFATSPWGSEPGAIPAMLEGHPQFGDMSPEQMRHVRSPLRIRLDAQGGVHALVEAPLQTPTVPPPFIHHFDAEGEFIGRTPLPLANRNDPDSSLILDYAVDADGSCYLLEVIQARQSNGSNNRLRKISSDGTIQWTRVGARSETEVNLDELKGTLHRLLMDGRSRLYLLPRDHSGVIAEIDRTTGEVARTNNSDVISDRAFMTQDGKVVSVLYFPAENRRGLGFFNLAEEKATSFVGGEELYGWLLYPIGVDSAANVYAWKDAAVARISAAGRIDVIAKFDNIVVRPRDGVIFTSRLYFDGEGGQVVRATRRSPGAESSHQDLRLSKSLSSQPGGGWKLIHVDEQGRFYVFGGEAPGQAGTLIIYSSNGALEEMRSPPPDLLPIESRMESQSFWDVDSRGRIYLPITDGQGFKIVRLAVP